MPTGSIPQNESVETQPTATPTATEPVATPTNVTQPTQKASMPPVSSPQGLGFSVAVVYGIAIGATVALVAASYVFYRRGRREDGINATISKV